MHCLLYSHIPITLTSPFIFISFVSLVSLSLPSFLFSLVLPVEGTKDTCIRCAAGTYIQIEGQTQCHDCMEGVICEGDGMARSATGYWMGQKLTDHSVYTIQVYIHGSMRTHLYFLLWRLIFLGCFLFLLSMPPQCPPDMCLADNQCAKGRVQPQSQNVLCGDCEAGRTEWGGDCVVCTEYNWPLIGFLFAATWAYVCCKC